MLDIETLQRVPLFANLPQERLHWLLGQGRELWLEPGQIHRAAGEPADYVFVILEGEIQIVKHEGQQEILLVTHVPYTLYGELPILTGDPHYWASGRAQVRCRIFEFGKEAFWEMLSSCSCVMTSILRTMALRMQAVQTLSQHREKLVALGNLAAGLAHELNNPAAAAQRAVRRLHETFQVLQPVALQLGRLVVDCEQQAFLVGLQREALARAASPPRLDPLTRSDREEEVAAWLEAHGVAQCWQLAPTLVGAGLGIDWLARIVERMPTPALERVLVWLEANLSGVGLLTELGQSTERISRLVKSIKDYSYLDQAPLQEVDIHQGLESTLTMLGHRLNGVIAIERDYDYTLPAITAYGSELNQVWTNLIDNAIDALEAGGSGCIRIRTRHEHEVVLVEIADDGPGIPAAAQSHIFDPFFTTKAVGEGTGLGLHIVYQVVVVQHHGDVRLLCEPGDTRFQVRLPIRIG
ncbi:ATP-binding protein [Gloeobacter morelensis]|uniref:histidine kinase n=1 Tax=Gloeobacter morelensis MG652769 TaxID=2781736 RepID=A0ABY3PPN9_9CYAN|nr:ATP-binding protein [Gloeobacter morelensis]UFP95508.1 cyclic nucleotide-binding domain-containing protein [Gloeobacter morelensis MG652769]